MLNTQGVMQHLRPGCVVTTSRRRYLVVKISDDRITFLGRPTNNIGECSKLIANVTAIHSWLIPNQQFNGWVKLREPFRQNTPTIIKLTDVYHDRHWVHVDLNNTIKGFDGGRIPITQGVIDRWTPVRPDDFSTGEVLVNHSVPIGNPDNTASMVPGNVVKGRMFPPPDWPVVEPENVLFKIEKEIKMEDIKLFKPENLAKAKEIAEQQRNDEETQKAKAFYETCINAIDKIDRQMKVLVSEKVEWEEKLKPFRDAVTSDASAK